MAAIDAAALADADLRVGKQRCPLIRGMRVTVTVHLTLIDFVPRVKRTESIESTVTEIPPKFRLFYLIE
jgi:hypothetical protein